MLRQLLRGSAVLFAAATLVLSSAAPPTEAQSNPTVLLQTTKGPILIAVYRSAAPNHANNFLDLVSRGFYNGKIFHRIESWCIQGGDPNGNGSGVFVDPDTGRPRYLPREISPMLSHSRPGVVAMARGNNPNSASCQFYILKRPMQQLDGQYSIFGQVLKGMNAVYSMGRGDRIISAEIVTSSGGEGGGGRRSAGGGSGASGWGDAGGGGGGGWSDAGGGSGGRSRGSGSATTPPDGDSGF